MVVFASLAYVTTTVVTAQESPPNLPNDDAVQDAPNEEPADDEGVQEEKPDAETVPQGEPERVEPQPKQPPRVPLPPEQKAANKSAQPSAAQPNPPAAAPPKPPVPVQPSPQLSPQQRKIAQLTDRVRQEMAKQTPQIAGKLLDGTIVERVDHSGSDLVFRSEGGGLKDRVKLYDAVVASMNMDPYWSDWLKHHGVFVSHVDLPWDTAEATVAVVPTPEESSQVDTLLQRVLDDIELDGGLSGAYVESADFFKPLSGPGRILKIHGRIINTGQLALLKDAFDRAAASLETWRVNRGDVSFVFDIVPGQIDRERSNRYFTIALEAFWNCDFFTARTAIARAISDDPTSRLLQYWRVVIHIAMGEEDRARRKLPPLIAVDPNGSNGGEIAVAFERVQGPLRWRLRALEQEVVLAALP